MKELSLNILDIAENSVKAKATVIEILLDETDERLRITVKDNGCGMKQDFLKKVIDPFTTSRTTRNVGLGIPLFKLSAQQTGGDLEIDSKDIESYPDTHGTVISALFYKNHIDFTPLGDVVSSLLVLIQGSPDIRFVFRHQINEKSISLDTDELKSVLGDVPLNTPDVLVWIRESLSSEYQEI